MYMSEQKNNKPSVPESPKRESATPVSKPKPREIGGPKGPEPTRYGDWERNGRCIDF
ncbi:MAG TPA: DUF1674 domain-containing protein [Gammaproteobacteria bacterium]|nr:DUF1674 domain-containing protein [Gammaproteobacteria bacterium]